MRISMVRTRNYVPTEDRRITVKFVSGQDYTVKRSWGAAMVGDGSAVEIEPPPRPDATAADGGNGGEPGLSDDRGE